MKKALLKTISGITLGAGVLTPFSLTSCNKTDKKTEIHIMSLSDIRGEIPGYGDEDFRGENQKSPGAIRVADAIQEIADQCADYLVLNAGDQTSSGKFSSCTYGETMYPVMKAMGVRYSTLGNHEWDWGTTRLVNTKDGYDSWGRTDKTVGHYFICSNVLSVSGQDDHKFETDENKPKFATDFKYWNNNRVDWADPYKIVDLAGHKICLIGLTTRETRTSSNSLFTKDFSFINYIPSVHYAKYLLKTTDVETYNQVESFILLTHCGLLEEEHWISGEAEQLANELDTPVDGVIAAHSRKNICGYLWNNKFNKKVAIAQVTDKMQSFIDMKLNFDDSKPIGQRFVSLEPKIITPKINNSSFNEAKKQLDDIIANPRNDAVKNVINEYKIQKQKVLERLKEPIGSTNTGLSYLQSDDQYAYKYPYQLSSAAKYENVLVEEAGAYACKSLMLGFNKFYDELPTLEQAKYKKANCAYITNVSIKQGINYETLEQGEVTLNELYDLFQYDDHTVTVALTYHQLEQVVRYMFTGYREKMKAEGRISDICTDEYVFEYGSKEAFAIPTLRFPFGPNQFYGFCFDVKTAESSDKQCRLYDYVGRIVNDEGQITREPTLKVYVPDVSNINDFSTWKGRQYFEEEATGVNKYITIVLNSFTYDYGNNQNMMIKMFGTHNESERPEKIKVHEFISNDVRDLAKDWISSSAELIEMSNDICRALAHIVG